MRLSALVSNSFSFSSFEFAGKEEDPGDLSHDFDIVAMVLQVYMPLPPLLVTTYL